MNLFTGPMPAWLKRVITITGLLLALSGLPTIFGFFCVALIAAVTNDRNAMSIGLISFSLMIVTFGAGGVVFWHGMGSLRGKVSKPIHLPPVWIIGGLFGLFIVIGLSISGSNFGTGLFFPPILFIASVLPSLLAISWFAHQDMKEITWRRGLIAFAGGATVSVAIAIMLEILLPSVILALVFNLANVVINSVEMLFETLAGKDLASAISSRGFIYLFVHIVIIAPLAEELAKPLVVLPLVGRLSRRGAFLVGAVAGAGFATLENVLYAGLGFFLWAGILVVRAFGGVIHPLGSGLVALGWRDILRGESDAWPHWFIRFGMSAGMHALWNAGSLLVIMIAGAQFFGELPPEIDVLGLSAAGTTLALLIVLGWAALWTGRFITQKVEPPDTADRESAEFGFTLSDRAIAIWALACLAAIVPVGITGLQILVR